MEISSQISILQFTNLNHPKDRFSHCEFYKIHFESEEIYIGQALQLLMDVFGKYKTVLKTVRLITKHCKTLLYNNQALNLFECSVIQKYSSNTLVP